MSGSFTVIIPARFGSTRFEGKPLAKINSKSMILHVIDRAKEAGASTVIVATDDQRIADEVGDAAQVCMTSPDHNSGTERLAEVIEAMNLADDDIVVNVQGDEPFIPAENIRQVAANLKRSGAEMATLSTSIETVDDLFNPNIVKVVPNRESKALYFSRSVVPFERDTMMKGKPKDLDLNQFHRHIGIYAYTAGYIKQYVNYAPSLLEVTESLEQLRALWYGDAIHIERAVEPPPIGIDTPEDLANLLAKLNEG